MPRIIRSLSLVGILLAGPAAAADPTDFSPLSFGMAMEGACASYGLADGIWAACVDLDGNGAEDVVTIDTIRCSDAGCPFEIFLHGGEDRWDAAGSFVSTRDPLWETGEIDGHRDIVAFEHLTDDCPDCSPHFPVRYAFGSGTYNRQGILASAVTVDPAFSGQGTGDE